MLTPTESFLFNTPKTQTEDDVLGMVRCNDTDHQQEEIYDRTALFLAAEKGYVRVIESLCAKNANLNVVDKHTGDNALHVATRKLQPDFVHALLIHQVDVNSLNASGDSALMIAITVGSIELVKLLLSHGASTVIAQKSALIVAATLGSLDSVSIILSHDKEHVSFKDQHGKTALMYACEKGHQGVVQVLAEEGQAPVDETDEIGRSALMLACDKGHVGIVQYLVSTQQANLSLKDMIGRTGLMYAADKGHEAVVAFILEQENHTMEEKDRIGRTALMLACTKGHAAIVSLFLQQNVKVDEKDQSGKNALMYTSEAGHLEIVHLLTQEGYAKIIEKDVDGKTALHYATMKAHVAIIAYLLTYEDDYDEDNFLTEDDRLKALLTILPREGGNTSSLVSLPLPKVLTVLKVYLGHELTLLTSAVALAGPSSGSLPGGISLPNGNNNTINSAQNRTSVASVTSGLLVNGNTLTLVCLESVLSSSTIHGYVTLPTATELITLLDTLFVELPCRTNVIKHLAYYKTTFSTQFGGPVATTTSNSSHGITSGASINSTSLNNLITPGKPLLSCMTSEVAYYFRQRIYIQGRYELLDAEPDRTVPLYCSTTKVIFRALDHGLQGEYEAEMALEAASTSTHNKARRRSTMSFFFTPSPRHVVIKFVVQEHQYQRELTLRQASIELEPYVLGSLDHFPGLLDTRCLAEIVLPNGLSLLQYPFGIVMPAAERSLDRIYHTERPDLLHSQRILAEIAQGLAHCHGAGIVHGDVKMTNIMRQDGKYRLIGLDVAATRLGKVYGQDVIHLSSGILPPEMFAHLTTQQEYQNYLQYWAEQLGKTGITGKTQKELTVVELETRNALAPKYIPSLGQYLVLKRSLSAYNRGNNNNSCKLPYEPIVASVSLDVWAFGVLCYQLGTGQAWLPITRDDTLITEPEAATFLAASQWDATTVEEVIGCAFVATTHSLARDHFKDLLRLIFLAPFTNSSSPVTMQTILAHPFFTTDYEVEGQSTSSDGHPDGIEESQSMLGSSLFVEQVLTACPQAMAAQFTLLDTLLLTPVWEQLYGCRVSSLPASFVLLPTPLSLVSTVDNSSHKQSLLINTDKVLWLQKLCNLLELAHGYLSSADHSNHHSSNSNTLNKLHAPESQVITQLLIKAFEALVDPTTTNSATSITNASEETSPASPRSSSDDQKKALYLHWVDHKTVTPINSTSSPLLIPANAIASLFPLWYLTLQALHVVHGSVGLAYCLLGLPIGPSQTSSSDPTLGKVIQVFSTVFPTASSLQAVTGKALQHQLLTQFEQLEAMVTELTSTTKNNRNATNKSTVVSVTKLWTSVEGQGNGSGKRYDGKGNSQSVSLPFAWQQYLTLITNQFTINPTATEEMYQVLWFPSSSSVGSHHNKKTSAKKKKVCFLTPTSYAQLLTTGLAEAQAAAATAAAAQAKSPEEELLGGLLSQAQWLPGGTTTSSTTTTTTQCPHCQHTVVIPAGSTTINHHHNHSLVLPGSIPSRKPTVPSNSPSDELALAKQQPKKRSCWAWLCCCCWGSS